MLEAIKAWYRYQLQFEIRFYVKNRKTVLPENFAVLNRPNLGRFSFPSSKISWKTNCKVNGAGGQKGISVNYRKCLDKSGRVTL